MCTPLAWVEDGVFYSFPVWIALLLLSLAHLHRMKPPVHPDRSGTENHDFEIVARGLRRKAQPPRYRIAPDSTPSPATGTARRSGQEQGQCSSRVLREASHPKRAQPVAALRPAMEIEHSRERVDIEIDPTVAHPIATEQRAQRS